VLLEIGLERLGRGLVREQLGQRLLAAVLQLEDRQLELFLRIDRLVERGVRLARNAALDLAENAHDATLAF